MKLRQFTAGTTPSSGFTLIELMITLGIGAILAAIAIPMYQKQVQTSRRTDARTAVLDLAGREERYLSVQASYTNLPVISATGLQGPHFLSRLAVATISLALRCPR